MITFCLYSCRLNSLVLSSYIQSQKNRKPLTFPSTSSLLSAARLVKEGERIRLPPHYETPVNNDNQRQQAYDSDVLSLR